MAVKVGSKNHKLDFNIAAHEDQTRDDADLSAHRTWASYLPAATRGLPQSKCRRWGSQGAAGAPAIQVVSCRMG